jgi:AcrR family transcriptional regulator
VSGSAVPASSAATEKGDLTRRHILDTAAAAFAKHGYAGTSLNDLIRDAGITKGGFYFHFPSKAALAVAVIEDRDAVWIREVSAAAQRHSRGIDQLTSMVDSLCDLYERDPSFGSVGRLCRELGVETRDAPDVGPRVFATWFQLISALILRAQDEGDVRPDLDPLAVAETCVAAFLGAKDLSDLLSDGTDLRRRMDAITDILLTGVRTTR